MTGLTSFLTSSIGRKVVMSLTGLFLILFLVIHLVGNLQLLFNDGGEAFNLYAKKMTTDPLIKTVSYLLYASILVHAFQGWALWRKNRSARGNQKYAVNTTRSRADTSGGVAKNMGWLGTIIFVFLLIHLYQFWFKMKIGALDIVTYDGVAVKDLYAVVKLAYANPGFVIFYVVSMVVIGAHLWHGFQSAFQTLGLAVKQYGNIIRYVGMAYSILIPLGFAIIPLVMYLKEIGII